MEAGISVAVLREDQNHPLVSGNKWWKLRPYLELAIATEKPMVTFGGPWSNHIYATAAACKVAGIKSFGIIRGEKPPELSATLRFAETCGMRLEFVSRESYRQKDSPEFRSRLRESYGDCLIVPEGGSGPEAVRHCETWGRKIAAANAFDVICLPVGTGGTFAGMLRGIPEGRRVIGFPALKDGGFLKGPIQELAGNSCGNWELVTDYHFGGYGKVPAELIAFIREMQLQYQLLLDAVYTAKMFWGIIDRKSTRLNSSHT